MAYLSGRTVKSKNRTASTVTSATRATRRLIDRLYGDTRWASAFTVDSVRTADPNTLEPVIRTVVTYPADLDASDLACAIERADGVVKSDWSTYALTIYRAA